MANLTPSPKMQFFDSAGAPLNGGKLYTYEAGTSTPLATYTDSGAGTPNANPVILDPRGEANVWCAASQYKFVLHDSNDVLIWSVDNINGADTPTINSILATLAATTGASLSGFSHAEAQTAGTLGAKALDTVSIKDAPYNASNANTTAENKTALQAAITAVNAAGGGIVIVPQGIDYGFINTDLTTYPDFSACTTDMLVEDRGVGDSDGSGNKCGSQIRYFHHTQQTSPVGQHDGNGNWVRGDWHPYWSVSNDANLAAANDPSRTVNDNRRASLLFNNDGMSTWRFGQGTLAGANYTNEELSNFVLEHYQTTGDTLADYAPLTIERKTGNWSFGGGTNQPAASYHFKSVTSGYVQCMFESLSTISSVTLRNSNGSADDITVRNNAAKFEVYCDGVGTAAQVDKATRNIGIGTDASTYRLDLQASASSGYVFNVKNANATLGNGGIIDSASTAGVGWSFLRMFSDSQVDEKFKFRGDGTGSCDVSWVGGGADRAEMFEWADGNPDGVDGPKQEVGSNRAGYTVSLINGKIKIAELGEQVIGVVSLTYDSLGNAAPLSWGKKYLRDDLGAPLYEDCEVWEWAEQVDGETVRHSYYADRVPDGVIVPEDKAVTTAKRKKINPSFDQNAAYVPRDQRKEWDAIGVIGICRVRRGQVTGGSWIKMRDISDGVEEWFVQ